jgi:hypothetical protein
LPRADAGLLCSAIFFDGLIQKSVLDAFLLCLALALLSRLMVHRLVLARGCGSA